MTDAAHRPRRPEPPPGQAALHEVALAYLARFAATRRGLLRVLERRIGRWHEAARRVGVAAEEAETARAAALAAARQVVQRLVEAGAVDDAAFSTARAGRLQRTGHSRRGIAAHLAGRGVASETVTEALVDMDELASALAFARRRRIGPFAPDGPAGPAHRRRELALLARAGFPRAVALSALATASEDAEEALRRLNRP